MMPNFEQAFCAAEERAFRFLIDDHGFCVADRDITPEGTNWVGGYVRYQSTCTGLFSTPKEWAVSLAFAPLRLELGCDIADGRGNRYSVAELHALVASTPFPRATHDLYNLLYDEDAMFNEFARLAGVLRQNGDRFFRGDATLWHELRTARNLRHQAEEDSRAVAQSEAAFQAKDWQKVVAVLESREHRLSKAASARLAFSRKKLLGI